MVKIVELDETETVGLASAGIGLAGSELPNKRKKKKARPPLDPLGGLAGMGNGTVTGGSSPGTSEPLPDEAKVPERPSANLIKATTGASASAAPGVGDETIETPSTKTNVAAPSRASILLTALAFLATASFAFYVTRTLATTLIAPYEREL